MAGIEFGTIAVIRRLPGRSTWSMEGEIVRVHEACADGRVRVMNLRGQIHTVDPDEVVALEHPGAAPLFDAVVTGQKALAEMAAGAG